MLAQKMMAGLIALAVVATACGDKPKTARKQPSPSSTTQGVVGSIASGSPALSSSPASERKKARVSALSHVAGRKPAAAGGPALGITDDAIEVVYYWRGDRTRTSPFLRGSAAEANVDEGKAFRGLVEYINKHADGGATLMGFPFDLHGRKIKGTVIEAGSEPEQNAAAAERIVSELKPFAALAAHGSVSTYVCPQLAAAGVYGLATYNLDFGLGGRSNGFCLPGAAKFEDQVRVMQSYLARRVTNATTRIGFLYSEYPGLIDSAPKIIDRFRKGGIPIVAEASMSATLTQAQGQAPGVVAKFNNERVNTVVMPDAAAALSFLPAAEASHFEPNYAIWPCSGQDAQGMVRLYTPNQWSRASGLTCYDSEIQPDVVADDSDKATEWYKAYKSVESDEPAATTAYIYAGLLPLVAGITGAGRNLDHDSFRAALAEFNNYRYSFSKGRTDDDRSLLVSLGAQTHPLLGDFTVLRWSNTARRPGSNISGAYVFPEQGRRYPPEYDFKN